MKQLVGLLCFTSILSAQQFNVVEAGITDMRTAMEQKRITSRELVTQYLVRIALYKTSFTQLSR